MELRHLRYFVAVAEDLSFSAAAERLHISQPPLSQQIQDLERELAIQLFDRTRRKIVLTSAGREFLRDARQLLKNVAQVEEQTRQRAAGTLGRLNVGVNSVIVTPQRFAQHLRAFQRRNPHIEITVHDHHSFQQLEKLVSGELDCGFLRPPAELPPNIVTHRIKREAMCIALPAHHRLARQSRIEWKDLTKESFVLLAPEIARNFYDDFLARCRATGFEPKVAQYASHAATQMWLISAGLGIAPMPVMSDIVKRSGISFRALPSDAPVYEMVMAWRRDDPSPVLQRFVKFVMSVELGRRSTNPKTIPAI